MSQALRVRTTAFPLPEPEHKPLNYLPFIKNRRDFTPEYEEAVRDITNMDGRGANAFDQEKEKNALPQDKLDRVWGWFHGNTGFVAQFRWESGRQDALVMLDAPEPSPEAIAAQQAKIRAFAASVQAARETGRG